MEEWINDYYDEIVEFFKIKKKLPLVIRDFPYFGKHRRVKYTIRKIDTINHTYKIFETGWQSIEIHLDKEWVRVCYENQKEHLFPFVIRTLIHELVHQKGYILHTKKFKRIERRMFIKWVAYVMDFTIGDVKNNKDLMSYIFSHDFI